MPRCRSLFGLAAISLAACQPLEDLGAVQVRADLEMHRFRAAMAGWTAPIRFAVPAGTGSILIEVKSSRGRYHLDQFITPSGQELIESGDYIVRESGDTGGGQASWLFPNSPTLESHMAPGVYEIVLRGETTRGAPLYEDLDLVIYAKRRHEGSCAIAVDFMVAEDALPAGDVARVIQEIVSIMAGFYRTAGIEIADARAITMRMPDGSAALEGQSKTVLAQVDNMIAFGQRENSIRSSAVHLMLVNWLGRKDARKESDELAGFSMGLPGPFDGFAPSAAVLISTTSGGSLPRDSTDLAVTAAHEMGHYLGLMHTAELKDNLVDPIPDSPPCLDEACSNIMAARSSRLRRDFSPGQGFVLQRHPLCVPGSGDGFVGCGPGVQAEQVEIDGSGPGSRCPCNPIQEQCTNAYGRASACREATNGKHYCE